MKLPHPISRTRLSEYKKLTQKKYRQQIAQCIIEGVHVVEEALASDWHIEALLVTTTFCEKPAFAAIRQQAVEKNIELCEVSDRDLNTLSDTVTAQGIVGIVRAKNYTVTTILENLSSEACVVVLDSVADPGNVGTIVRTCDWFGVDAVVLGGASVELTNPKVLRSAMGSVFHIPVIAVPQLLSMLKHAKQAGWQIQVTALKGGAPMDSTMKKGRSIFVFGSEAHGVSPEIRAIAENIITFSRRGKAESLNVAVACGVLLGVLNS